MIPGSISRGLDTVIAASTIISPKSDFVRVTDTTVTTVVTTINSPFFGVSGGMMILINDSGNPINFTSTGNIDCAATRTIANKFAIPLVFSKVSGKWYIGAITF
jgi:hypothetical protein